MLSALAQPNSKGHQPLQPVVLIGKSWSPGPGSSSLESQRQDLMGEGSAVRKMTGKNSSLHGVLVFLLGEESWRRKVD